MFIEKKLSFRGLMAFSGGHLVWLTLWGLTAVSLYHFTGWTWLAIPWLPVSLVGLAVAFFVGFKNNSAYDRMWEARKIWGAIINSSRSWGSICKHLVSNQFNDKPISKAELHGIHTNLIYRHIAWLYTLREQLLKPTSWEHIEGPFMVRWLTKKRIENFGTGIFEQKSLEDRLGEYLGKEEVQKLLRFKNTATQIIDKQGAVLQELREKDLIDDFRHMELQKMLIDFYTQQGKSERIKKFPFPRQYASMSFYFVALFIVLLPFGLLSELAKLENPNLIWLAIPFSVIVGWVFLTMELVGDYSENPFEGMANDIPMLALCRTIEIDLREMLGEEDIPEGIKPQKGILM